MKYKQVLSLAATITSDWYEHLGGPLKIVADFGVIYPGSSTNPDGAGVADAVGTLAVTSYPAQTISWTDELGATQTALTVGVALNGLSHEFVVADAPKGRYRVAYTRSSGGAADIVAILWG